MDAPPRDETAPGVALSTPALSRLIRKPRGLMAWLQTAGIVLLLLGLASIPLMIGFSTWYTRQAMRKEWTAHGPACPVVPQVSRAALGPKPPRPFVYQGVGFAYQIGDVSCVALPRGYLKKGVYPVCEFDAPAGIAVRVGGRTTFFEPGVGHGATVTIRDGQVSCIVTGSRHN
jgi:hypothetical protein